MAAQTTSTTLAEPTDRLQAASGRITAPAQLKPTEAWTAAARFASLLGTTAAREDDPSLRLAEVFDRSLHYAISRLTLGLSPMALAETYFDWLVHLSLSPGKQLQLWHKGLRKSARLASHLARCMAQFGQVAGTLHLPPAAGQAVQQRRMAPLAVQSHSPELSAAATVVAQRDDRHTRRLSTARAGAGIRQPPDPRRGLAVQLRPDES